MEEVGVKVGFNYVSGDVAVPINVICADFLGGVQSRAFASWVNGVVWTQFFALFDIEAFLAGRGRAAGLSIGAIIARNFCFFRCVFWFR